MSRNSLSRRRLVQFSGSALLVALAGCPGDQNGTPTPGEDASPETEAPEEETPETEAPEEETPETETPEEETPETETPGEETPETETAAATPSISVSDQQTAGQTLTVASAAIDRVGWLVIHPAADGEPDAGTVLGATLLDPGTSSDVEVELDESLSESQTLYAMLHYDDPADGEFTFSPGGDEDPAVTVDGSAVVVPFEATVE